MRTEISELHLFLYTEQIFCAQTNFQDYLLVDIFQLMKISGIKFSSLLKIVVKRIVVSKTLFSESLGILLKVLIILSASKEKNYVTNEDQKKKV